MKVFYLLLVFPSIFVVSSGKTVHNDKVKLSQRADEKTMEEALLIFFEELRCRMNTPMDDLNLPTLDPFTADSMDFDLDHNLGSISGTFSNLRIEGLSEFTVNDLRFNYNNLDFWIDTTLPRLSLSGYYDIDGSLGGLLPIFGNGNFSIVLTEMHAVINSTIDYNGLTVAWNMPEFQMDFHLGNLTTVIDNLFNDDELSDFFNLAFTTLGADIVDVMFSDIEPEIADMAKEMTSDLLNGVTIEKFLDIIFLIEPFLPPLADGEVCEYEINYPL
ncbi:hypothetical protein DMENIID0001_033510 [Sergentomyia squamirostris]